MNSGGDLITKFEYDELGQLTKTTDPKGLQTTYTYDKRGQLTQKNLPDQDYPNKYRYSKDGLLRFHRTPNQDASGDPYNYITYDELGRPTEEGSYNSSSYFDNSAKINDLDWPTSGNTAKVKYTYDNATYSGSISFSVDNAEGKVARRRSRIPGTSNWNTTWYSYNNQGLVSAMVQDLHGLGEKLIEYTYDRVGRVTQIDYQNRSGVSDTFFQKYSYDELGRLAKVESSTDNSDWITDAQYTYTADGQQDVYTLSEAGKSMDYSYGSQGWLKTINTPGSLGSDEFALELGYNHDGNISSSSWNQSINSGLITFDYTYDNAKRLTQADNTASNNYWTSNYQYDKNGNISYLGREDDSGNENPDDYLTIDLETTTNRIEDIGINFQTYYMDYDASGNMTRNDVNGLSAASYDWRNLPESLSANGSTVTYAYDGDGQRVSKTVGGTTTYYVRGAGGETIAVYTGTSHTFTNILAGGEIIGNYDGSTRRYYLKDHLGSVRTTIDDNGYVDGYDDYYPFGKVMPGRSTNSANPNDNYKFTGHELDTEAGVTLSYAGARYLDSEIGRWLSVDPLAENFPGWSPYNYGMNNPVNMWDPDGKAATNCCLFAPMGLGLTSTTAKAMGGDKDAQASLTAVHKANAAVGLAVVPGPEDVALGALMVSKAGQALARIGARATGLIKGLFKGGDEAINVADDAVKAVNNPYLKKSASELSKSRSSFEKLIKEHTQKLADFKENPDKFDNRGILKNASHGNRKKIIEGRIKALQKQIQKQKNELDKVNDAINNQN
ncbi:MAG: RHS repeat protein [Balneolaceae bacterium]|nr:RHS repeat protein [Balneolaceae bacterium]